ncbi:MAG TPA: SulP family inorganic anion transporter [Methanoculleus sp.]|jgi:SulP family sulfate permease|uniref:SulP family inorganic anion transporter n=1 Tax=Methanoculleus sp. TaxID=90427 RepID=UPI002D0B150E|nr:SulP family inorganic anion transporter [Methanoculleus sp.]HOC84623.1 SulP family inorganic anion transporter [Methanoculleus sp.]HQL59388.1 SulP family inorganic anion transporter [Methanoculleus sp.]
MPSGEPHWRKSLSADIVAGTTTALVGIPQTMGFALVAGINPIYGLYTAAFSTAFGALLTGSSFLKVMLSNVIAVSLFSILAPVPESDIPATLFVLTLLVGLFQLGFGLARAGSLTRFISNAVLTGFIIGAALLIVLGQLGNLTGYELPGDAIQILAVLDLILHAGDIQVQPLAVGLLTIALALTFRRAPRLSSAALLLPIVITTLLVRAADLEVALVGDISAIPAGLPFPVLPELALAPGLLVPALALAIIGLVMAIGITEKTPEPDGTIADVNRDFAGQGVANILASFFQCAPSSGSLSATTLNVSAGAETRAANLISGILVGAVILVAGPLAELIPLSALAGILILIGAELIYRPHEIVCICRYSRPGRWGMIATFISTQVLPLQYSIYVGVFLSLAIYLITSTREASVVRLVPVEGGMFREESPPGWLPDGRLTILSIAGSVYFATLRAIERSLPSPEGTDGAVVILALRGRVEAGTGFFRMLERYARRLLAHNGRLILAEVDPRLLAGLAETGVTETVGPANIFVATPTIWESLMEAIQTAEAGT